MKQFSFNVLNEQGEIITSGIYIPLDACAKIVWQRVLHLNLIEIVARLDAMREEEVFCFSDHALLAPVNIQVTRIK